jgi:hypothetical protein
VVHIAAPPAVSGGPAAAGHESDGAGASAADERDQS